MDRLSRVGGTGLLISDGRGGSTFWFKKFLKEIERVFVFNLETSS